MTEQSETPVVQNSTCTQLDREPSQELSSTEKETRGDDTGQREPPPLSVQSEKDEGCGAAVRPEEAELKKRSGKRTRKEKHTEVHGDLDQDQVLGETAFLSKTVLMHRPDLNPSEDHVCSSCQHPTQASSVPPQHAPQHHVTARKIALLAFGGSQFCPQTKVRRSKSFTKSCNNCDQVVHGAPAPEFDAVDFGELAAPPKRCRTLYNPDQLELLEALFQVERYPDSERRKAMAQLVGVTPQRVLVWFQNRRAKYKKINSLNGGEGRHRRALPVSSVRLAKEQSVSEVPSQRPNSSLCVPYTLILPQSSPEGPCASAQSSEPYLCDPGTQADLNAPAASTSTPSFSPRKAFTQCTWISPPPLRRVTALHHLFTSSYSAPPPFNTPEFTPPFLGDSTEGLFSKDHHDDVTMTTYPSFPFNFMENFVSMATSQHNNNNNNLFYQPATFPPTGPTQETPQVSQSFNPSSSPRSYMTYCGDTSANERHVSAQNQRPVQMQPVGEHGVPPQYLLNFNSFAAAQDLLSTRDHHCPPAGTKPLHTPHLLPELPLSPADSVSLSGSPTSFMGLEYVSQFQSELSNIHF